ncbi:MAG TPA: cytochrome c [Polyangiaceae bacterium]|nr:cytochrome c [Polyangiaceae bacterium]
MRTSLAAGLLLLGCNSPPEDAREWRASDHDHTSNPRADQVEVQQGAAPPPPAKGVDEVTIVAWSQNCSRCHGTVGRGDGPQGPATRPRDLTDAAWQSSVSDESIAQVIRNGRGMMPAFPLPEATVQSLVRLVRLFDARQQEDRGAQQAPSQAHDAPPAAASPAGRGAPAAR